MCVERFKIGLNRPLGPARPRFRVGPSSAVIFAMYKSSEERPYVPSALATAERMALATGLAAALGRKLSMTSASSTSRLRTRSATSRTLRGDMRMYFATALTSNLSPQISDGDCTTTMLMGTTCLAGPECPSESGAAPPPGRSATGALPWLSPCSCGHGSSASERTRPGGAPPCSL